MHSPVTFLMSPVILLVMTVLRSLQKSQVRVQLKELFMTSLFQVIHDVPLSVQYNNIRSDLALVRDSCCLFLCSDLSKGFVQGCLLSK